MKNNFENKYVSLGYNKLYRYILYYYQIRSIIKTKPENVLDIGAGSKTVSDELKKLGLKVSTCDIDKNVRPDFIGSIDKLPLQNKQFDTVSACEVLEHIPFSKFEPSIKELNRVAKKYVIISIPYSSAFIQFRLKILFKLCNKNINIDRGLILRIPYLFREFKVQKDKHYWEMGAKSYSKKKIKKIIKKYFTIENEFFVPYSPRHYFFILKHR